MKPSEISLLLSFPPLIDTMGRVEREAAATLLVRACQHKGDTWAPMEPLDIGAVIKYDLENQIEPLCKLNRNPFWRPDFCDLVDKGFARWTTTNDQHAPIEFTKKGLEVLSKHRR